MDKDDWWAWIDNAPSYKIQYSEHWRKYSKSLEADTKWVEEKLMLGKPVTKQMRTGYNTPAYRLFMNIKDFINDVNGKPTQHRFEDTEETDFERLFDFV
jgi:hypothetical protein